MIKLFRNIRKSLLSTAKTTTYFKYAIGEILLVVIGILIALQINNWNEDRKNTAKETQFLESFKKDIKENIIELNRVIAKSENTSKSADSVYLMKQGKIEISNMVSLLRNIMNATDFTVYSTHEGTVQDILGSGSLEIIKNDSIRLAIASWQANLKILREYEKIEKKSVDAYYDYLQLQLDLYKENSYDIIDEQTKTKLFQDRVFLNYLTNRNTLPKTLNELYREELPYLERLLSLIDEEL